MTKNVIVAIDPSYHCTGITIVELNENNACEKYHFFRVMYDKAKTKTGKPYKPRPVKNINDYVYTMPTNIDVNDIIIDEEDENNAEQCEVTLKSMMSSQKIYQACIDVLSKLKNLDNIYIALENYIMPSFNGKNNLKNVSGLIILQGLIRRNLIMYAIKENIKIKLLTPTPKTVKSKFSYNGDADKDMMVNCFINDYDGAQLIPEIKNLSVDAINDVVDSFAIAWYAYGKIIKKINGFDEENNAR